MGWEARLRLQFARNAAGKTLLTEREHEGPLRVQKALYPEGDAVCHAVLLHPPGGIAGGDQLQISAHLLPEAQVLITTPGATKWYKANGASASQQISLNLAAGSHLDWLPQDAIFFEACDARSSITVDLDPDASFFGWELQQLGRSEGWPTGQIQLNTTLNCRGQALWLEQALIKANSPLLKSSQGLANYPVMASCWAVGKTLNMTHCEALQSQLNWTDGARAGASFIKQSGMGLVVLRLLAQDAETARAVLINAWQQLRQPLSGHLPAAPRLWKT
jgi:urease accessory protein